MKKQEQRGKARAKTKGQEGVCCSPGGARKSLRLENQPGNEFDYKAGVEHGQTTLNSLALAANTRMPLEGLDHHN